jgi:hypothetical protein
MSQLSDVERRLSRLEATINDLENCNRGNVTAFMRLKAQASAVYSLLAEITEKHGFPAEVISAHFRVRSDYYLDRMLSDAENESPVLGAILDDRRVEEVPEFDGFPPLFAGEDLGGGSGETGH